VASYPCGDKHKGINDFSGLTHLNIRLWICSSCERRASWGPTWSYFGKIECRKCWDMDITWVACSEACARELGGDNLVAID
jgi:hypothetical protein